MKKTFSQNLNIYANNLIRVPSGIGKLYHFRSKSKPSLIEYIRNICALYMIIWAISPPLARPTIFRIIFIFAFLIFVFTSGKYPFRRNAVILIGLFFYILYSAFAIYTYGGYQMAWSVNIAIIMYLSYYFIFIYYKEAGFYKIKPLFGIIILILIIWNYFTIKEIIEIPQISRILTINNEDNYQYEARGIGGFGFVYSQVLLAPLMLKMIFSLPKSLKKTLYILYFISASILIVMAGFSIAIIVFSLSVLLVCTLKKITIIILFSWFLLFGGTYFLFDEKITSYIGNLAEGSLYERKINDILISESKSETAGTLDSRTSLYLKSFRTFIKHPIVGNPMSIGGHSTILDKFAQFGIFIGSLFSILLFYIPYTLYAIFKDSKSKFIISVFILNFILIVLLNPLQLTYAPIVFILLPSILDQIRRNNKDLSTKTMKISNQTYKNLLKKPI